VRRRALDHFRGACRECKETDYGKNLYRLGVHGFSYIAAGVGVANIDKRRIEHALEIRHLWRWRQASLKKIPPPGAFAGPGSFNPDFAATAESEFNEDSDKCDTQTRGGARCEKGEGLKEAAHPASTSSARARANIEKGNSINGGAAKWALCAAICAAQSDRCGRGELPSWSCSWVALRSLDRA
jgi:hypothetical protein